MKRYGHGGDIFAFSQKTGFPAEKITDFSASINPLGMSRFARRAAKDALALVHNYPEPFQAELAGRIADHLGVNPRCVMPANGSTELIYLLPRAFRPRTVLVQAPSFSEYERAALVAGAAVKTVEGIRLDAGRFIDAMQGAEMAFLCNPNNPTGELVEKETVLEIAKEARRRKCLLAVDEAFMDFCPGKNSVCAEAGGGGEPLHCCPALHDKVPRPYGPEGWVHCLPARAPEKTA